MRLPVLLRRLPAVGLTLALAACGGGSEPSATGSAGTGAASPQALAPVTVAAQGATGTITGFGSVIVDGVTYGDANAVVKVETDAAQPTSATTADLKLGMQVELTASASGEASTVTVVSAVLGRVSAKTTDGFTVAAQTVRVSTDPAVPTVWDGVAGLAELATGDFVEVHGPRDSGGAILASRVERKDPSSSAAVRVSGAVADLDTAARTFSVGGLRVRWSDATRLAPSGVTLANGQSVAIWSNQAVSGGTLEARSVVVRRAPWNGGDALRVGGPIRELDFAARTFRLDTIRVDASSAAFDKGTAADLANGRTVRVRGAFVDGTLKATEVRYVREQGDALVMLNGTVGDYAGASSFKVRGVPVDASGTGVTFVDGTAQNLGNGVLVKIEGAVEGSVVRPSRVTFVTTANGQAHWWVGSVSGYDAATGRFRLMNLDSRLNDTTTFRNADGSAAVRADFGNGDLVQARGAVVAGVFQVAEVMFRNGPSLVVDSIEGGVYEVEAAAGRFRLNGTLVQVGPSTTIEGSLTNLRNGARVEVSGTVVAGVLLASKVEVRAVDGGESARVRGLVSEFVSPGDFRVAGQKVDASTASYLPSGASAADLANGRFVEVQGPVVDGTLRAVRVVLK